MVVQLPSIDLRYIHFPSSGGKGYEHLLGMNYLKNSSYQVNFDKSVIEWGS